MLCLAPIRAKKHEICHFFKNRSSSINMLLRIILMAVLLVGSAWAGIVDRVRIALLQSALRTYGSTSIRDRLQKNVNLLTFQGKLAPTLNADQFLGPKFSAPDQLHGHPTLLFFWAHWCSDCKAEAPIITQLRSEFASKGLQVIGPTRLYGYTAQIEHASASDELRYIDAVRHRFYSGLLDMPVPISKYNLDTYGASTTPTLVLLDRTGKVAMYHPGALPYAELRAGIEKVV